jgi:hypothetical protein
MPSKKLSKLIVAVVFDDKARFAFSTTPRRRAKARALPVASFFVFFLSNVHASFDTKLFKVSADILLFIQVLGLCNEYM